MKRSTIPMGQNWPSKIGNRDTGAMAHRRRRRRPIPVTDGERGWGKWPRGTSTARGSDLGRWRERELTMEHAPWRQRSAGGERRGGRHPVVVANGSGLREKSRAQAVLTVALAGQSRGRRCRAMVVHLWTRRRLRILSPTPLLCRCVRASPCLREGWCPVRSWTGRSRRGSTAHQRWQ
jgi:hypothetical protein